jgi:hypothetical protein
LKLGTENRRQVILLAVLGVVALVMVGRALFGSFGPEPAASVPAAAAAPAPAKPVVRGSSRLAKAMATPPRLDPTLDLALLKSSEEIKYEGTGKNIFVAQAEVVIPKPVKPGVTDNAKPRLPVTPPPPPILLKFFGFASRPGEPKKIFLSQGEDVFIASEGEIVNRRYKIVRISPASVEIEDVVTSHRQNIPLTQS